MCRSHSLPNQLAMRYLASNVSRSVNLRMYDGVILGSIKVTRQRDGETARARSALMTLRGITLILPKSDWSQLKAGISSIVSL